MIKAVLGKRVLAEPVKIKQENESGIIIPETIEDNEPTSIFRAVAIGDEVTKVKVDDICHILPRGGNLYKIDGKVVLDEGQIVLIERSE